MRRKTTIGVVVSLLVLASLIAVGRHERSAWEAKENRGIAGVRQAVGARLADPTAYRSSPQFACLLYARGADLGGLELCFAPTGAIVEAIERTPGLDPKVWTIRSDPGGARVRENPLLIARLLDGLGAQSGPRIVVGGPDLGAITPRVRTPVISGSESP
jgi:hypothetical protein